MIGRIKAGIILMLIGIGIPTVLMFFSRGGKLFSITREIRDDLRQDEVDTLNSIYHLSETLQGFDLRDITEKVTKAGLNFEGFADLSTVADKLDEVKKAIAVLMAKADKYVQWRKVEVSGKRGEFVFLTPVIVGSEINIPFSYFIGIGVMFFITGLGIVIVSLIGRKGRMS